MKKIFYFVILITISQTTFAQNLDSYFSLTNTFMDKFVHDGKVNYDAIKKNPTSLDDLLEIAATMDLSKKNSNTTKAFWINTYNICVIKGIVNKYPVKSPLDISGFFDKIVYKIANKKVTINYIENKMLRANDDDARIHFVLVCGANGCPQIIDKAYFPDTLDEQLNKQTKLALNNPNFVKVNNETKKVLISQIFEWYKEDFVSKNSKEIDFINKFRTEKISSSFKLGYYTYDWSLNKKTVPLIN